MGIREFAGGLLLLICVLAAQAKIETRRDAALASVAENSGVRRQASVRRSRLRRRWQGDVSVETKVGVRISDGGAAESTVSGGGGGGRVSGGMGGGADGSSTSGGGGGGGGSSTNNMGGGGASNQSSGGGGGSGTCMMMGEHLKSPDEITDFPCFPEGTKSLLSKFLSREIWDTMKDEVDMYGYTFKQAIFSGAKFTNSGIGVYAGSHMGYYSFMPLMGKIIQDYHGHGPTDKHISDMDYTKLQCPELSPGMASMINSVRIRVARNLAAFPLGTTISLEQRKKVEEFVTTALSKFGGELKGKYYPLTGMSDADRQKLIADHFLFKGGDKYLQACGLEQDWPESRGIFHNDDKTFLVWVNEEDQLRIISMQDGADIPAVFKRLSEAAALIEKEARFANDEHLGYITSCPTNLGTGMRASVHVNLPKLGQRKEEFQTIADKYFVQIRGANGEHSEDDSGLYDISNKRRLGFSEVQLVQDMCTGVQEMLKREGELQEQER